MTPGNFCWSCECAIAGVPVVIYFNLSVLKSADFEDPGEINGIGYDEAWGIAQHDYGFAITHDVDGNYIATACDVSGNLKQITRTGGFGETWNIESVTTNAYMVDIAYTDTPYIAFGNLNVNPTYKKLQLAEKSAGIWGVTDIHASAYYKPSIVVSDNGDVHVCSSSAEFGSGDLYYHNRVGSTWTPTTIAAIGGGGHPIVALDNNGVPNILFTMGNTGSPIYQLKLAVFNGSTWDVETLTDVAAYHFDLSFDSENNPVICYVDFATKDSYYSIKSGGAWSSELIVTGTTAFIRMMIDASGVVKIAYFDNEDGDNSLWLAVKSGTGWTSYKAKPTGESSGYYNRITIPGGRTRSG
jgi:hypothetical protein